MNQNNPQQAQNISNTLLDGETPFINLSADGSKPSLDHGIAVLNAIKEIKRELLESGGVNKSRRTESTNNKFNYNYRSMGDIYKVINPLMDKHNVICFPHTENAACSKYVNGKGDIMFKVFVAMRFIFVSTLDGSSFEVCVIGEANDPADKALAKATTAAEKILYEKTFNITSEIENGTIAAQPQQSWSNNNRQQSWSNNNRQQNSNNRQQNSNNRQQNNGNQQQNAQPTELATLTAKNALDERLRQYGTTLIDCIKERNLDFARLTRPQLLQIQTESSKKLKHK